MFLANLKLVVRDLKEDWADVSLCEFIRWQAIKVKQGICNGHWPWTEG
jgi:hypothetical protein